MEWVGNRLIPRLRRVLAGATKLPTRDVDEVESPISHGEQGIAAETLCARLYEYDIAVNLAWRDSLREGGQSMGLKDHDWLNLEVAEGSDAD